MDKVKYHLKHRLKDKFMICCIKKLFEILHGEYDGYVALALETGDPFPHSVPL